MKVYVLVYDKLFEDTVIVGIYSSYEKAEKSIPTHEDIEFYDIFEETLDETCYL